MKKEVRHKDGRKTKCDEIMRGVKGGEMDKIVVK
jgi:hypothetical protein